MFQINADTLAFIGTLNGLSRQMNEGCMDFYAYTGREDFGGILYNGSKNLAEEFDLDCNVHEIVMDSCEDDIISTYTDYYPGIKIYLCIEEDGEKWILVNCDGISEDELLIVVDEDGWYEM